MTRNEVIIKNAVTQDYITPSSNVDGKYTKTTQFMLPAVKVHAANKTVNRFFINSYLDDMEHPHNYDRPIFVLFGVKDFKDNDWRKIYAAFTLSPDYITDYDCGVHDDIHLVMMVFKVPEEFAKDYYHFKRGRYSQFSIKYRDKFPRWIYDRNGKQQECIIWQVINKAYDLRQKIAEEFAAKRPDGTFYDPEDVVKLRADIDSWNEIWDIPRKNREYYRYNEGQEKS